LHFVQSNATFNSEKVLLLETLEKNNKNHESNILYVFEIAKILKEKAKNYQNSNKEKDPFKNREAFKFVMKLYINSLEDLKQKNVFFLKTAI
jgi:hypothetical protein